MQFTTRPSPQKLRVLFAREFGNRNPSYNEDPRSKKNEQPA